MRSGDQTAEIEGMADTETAMGRERGRERVCVRVTKFKGKRLERDAYGKGVIIDYNNRFFLHKLI